MKGLNEIKNALFAFAKKAKLKDGGVAINAKVKSLSGAQLAKIAGAAELANLFDSAADQAPLLSNIYKWWAQTVDTIYSNTVYKIPAVGDFIRNISDTLGKLVVPNAQKYIQERRDNMNKKLNHPKFYENLDLHKTFSIPGAYTKKTVVNGTMGTPKLAVHRVNENPMPDKSATVDRMNQKFSLIKAVRGLSATAYSLIDLVNYERFTKINLLMYYTVKKVVQAAKTYSLVQTKIGDNIISAYGFDPQEVRSNLANYETLLCQMHRFITNNLPVSGTWTQRLEYLVAANIPDYSDPKVATVHMFAVSINSVFYDSKNVEEQFVFDCIPNSNANSYSIVLTNFENFQDAIVNNTLWQQLIADYFGAFGSQCIWQDPDYPSYATPLNLANGDNDLNREQIKNAFYLNSTLEIMTITAGVENKRTVLDFDDFEPIQLPLFEFGDKFQSSNSQFTGLTYSNILDHDAYLHGHKQTVFTNLSSNNHILIPDMNGIGAKDYYATTFGMHYIPMDNHETIYTLHKDSYTEGEALEISQFKLRSVGMQFEINQNDKKIVCDSLFKTHEYAIAETVVYVFANNGSSVVDMQYTVHNEAISDDDLQAVESPVDFPDELMCWALIDWMPLTHFTFFGLSNNTYSPRDMALIDMDAFGSLDDRAFVTSINYSIYSLLGAGLKVGNKRVDNLGNIYKDKPSKRG